MGKIRDCVLFSNETDLLRRRFEYYKNHVDEFVIVESNKNFYGEDRDLIFETLKDEFKDLNIQYIVCDNFQKIDKGVVYPWGEGPWKNETQMREYLSRFVADSDNDDLFIISDCDEFYNRDLIKDHGKPVTFYMTNNYFYVDYVQHYNDSFHLIPGPQMFTKQNYFDFKGTEWDGHESHLNSVQGMRNGATSGFKTIIRENAWHFSYFGGVDTIKRKLDTFAHTEYYHLRDKSNDYFIDKINNFQDILDRNVNYKIVNNLTEDLNKIFSNEKYHYKKL